MPATALEAHRIDPGQRPAVQLGARAQRDGQPEVRPRLVPPAELAKRRGEREVRPMCGRIDLEELLERLACPLVLPAVVVRAAQRLQDRALARLLARRALEDDR